MECNLFNRTGAYIDREMTVVDREAFEAHLPSCVECTREVARLQRLSKFLAAAEAPPVNFQRLLWKVRRGNQGLVRFAEVLTAAAAAIILICGIWLMRRGDEQNASAAANWERMVITQQFPAPPAEPEDPLVQVLLREQP